MTHSLTLAQAQAKVAAYDMTIDRWVGGVWQLKRASGSLRPGFTYCSWSLKSIVRYAKHKYEMGG